MVHPLCSTGSEAAICLTLIRARSLLQQYALFLMTSAANEQRRSTEKRALLIGACVASQPSEGPELMSHWALVK